MKGCPKCGVENTDATLYCQRCGASLRADERPSAERKVVSVLFVDLVGFTAHSDRADPEDVRDLLQLYHSKVKEQAERFGGTVEKFIGDAVMAVFGAPNAHTDDPERAVRAGLMALKAVQELNQQQPGLDFSARASVNTGEAVVSIRAGRTDGGALAMGDVVNTAARLQTFAPPGRLVVGEETYRSTRESILYEAIGEVEAKGKRDPFKAWLAVEPLAAPERRMGASPLVGRDRELALLQSVWEAATEQNRPHLVTLFGPPGIGKSRLFREFARLVEKTGGRAIRGRCLPYNTQDVYGAFAEQVRSLAQIFEEDDPKTARAKLVERLGLERPTLLVFEDVHWADAGQLELINYLAAHVRDTPVVLLALARPELLDERPAWGTGVHASTTISLDPVSTRDATVMVGNLVGEELAPNALRRLVEVAGGNPLFLEELVAGLMEGAEIGAQLPTSVRAAIAARVDALPPEQRAALLAASVVGKVFWRGALRALGKVEHIDEALDALEARDLVRREATSRVQSDVEYSFKHILIRDVCYGTLTRSERRTAHELVASYIEQVAREKDRELSWLLAHHWQEAGDSHRAIDYLLLAAERSQEAMAEDETVDLLRQAETLAADDDTRNRIQLLVALARVKFEDYDRAAVDLEALIPRLDGADMLEALLALARCCHWTERTTQTLEVAQRALEMAERLGAKDVIGPAMARLSQGHAMRGQEGDLNRAIELGERALTLWIPGTRDDDLADHEHLLADQHYWTANYARALELSHAARKHAVDPTSAEAQLRAGGLEGLLLTAMGRYEEALASFDRVIALGRDLGRPVRVLLNYSSMTFRDLFDLGEARRRSEESLTQQGRSAAFHMPWMNAEVDLIQTDLLAFDVGAADERWRRMWQQVITTPAWERWFLGGKMAAFRAEIALQSKSYEEAAEWSQKAIDMARAVRRAKYEAAARGTLGKALLGIGRSQDGIQELQAAVGTADRLGSPALRWRLRVELASALGAIGDDNAAQIRFKESAGIIREVEAGLAPERARRFASAPQVADVLRIVGR